jgi:hypothetical protein
VWDDYLRASAGDASTAAILDSWAVDAVLVSARDQPQMLAALNGASTWRAVASDSTGALFVRRAGS